MKISPRLLLPAVLALGFGIVIGGLFLWQIHASISTIESSFKVQSGGSNLLKKLLPDKKNSQPDSTSQSQALMQRRQGEIFELKGEWKQAEEHYAQSVTAGGGAPALRKLAAIQLQRREYDAAKQTISTLKEENPDSDDLLLLEGLLQLRSGKAENAKAIFSKKPNAAQSLYGLGLVAITQGDSDGAKAALTKALDAGDPTIRSYAQAVLQAYTDFSLFPNGQTIHLQTLLARALAQVNECETALSLVNQVVVQQSQYRDAWIVKGYCEFATERTKDALTSLEQAYSLDPEKPEIQYFLARTHAALGDPQNAVTFLQYAIVNGFEPENDARELLAEYAQELGNTALALDQYKLLAEKSDSELAAYQRYVNLAITLPDHGLDALALAKSALIRWPDDPAVLTLSARAAMAAGLPSDADSYVNRALKIDPKDPRAIEVQETIRKGVSSSISSSKPKPKS